MILWRQTELTSLPRFSRFFRQRPRALPRIIVRGFLLQWDRHLACQTKWRQAGNLSYFEKLWQIRFSSAPSGATKAKAKSLMCSPSRRMSSSVTPGGNNAGHTVFIGRKKYVLHLVPSGILRKDKLCVIGNGVVVDPIGLVEEIEGLKKIGVKVSAKNFCLERDGARRFSVSPRTGRPARSAQGQEQNRHNQARHRPGLRRQGGARRACA